MNDISLTVQILNLSYELRGFDAIRDLKLWLDANASSCWQGGPLNQPMLGDTASPPTTAPPATGPQS